MTAAEVLAAVREATKSAAAAGELPAFLAELERVRTEALIAASSPPEPRARAVEPPRLLTVKEAAARLGRSADWIYRNKSALPLARLPTGGYGFPSERLEEWIRRRCG